MSGRVDRVDLRGDELVVVDYKTGRAALTDDDARGSLALALYALACARTLRRPCTRVELHHLPTQRVLSWEHSPETLARHVRRAEGIAAEAAATQALRAGGDGDVLFPARPSAGCAWCDLNRACPVAKVPPRKPWDGLASEQPEPDEG